MGLQHELGISPLVAAFGPTTLSRLTAYGDIGVGQTNANMVNLVQYAVLAGGIREG
ncbi:MULTISPECIES: hypothetical protein [unclassified Streptomyces]|uniref:hypothetical protein n=1 Tax=unclassified Streptomyces TaxID=2593676 RepID=UPI003077B5DF